MKTTVTALPLINFELITKKRFSCLFPLQLNLQVHNSCWKFYIPHCSRCMLYGFRSNIFGLASQFHMGWGEGLFLSLVSFSLLTNIDLICNWEKTSVMPLGDQTSAQVASKQLLDSKFSSHLSPAALCNFSSHLPPAALCRCVPMVLVGGQLGPECAEHEHVYLQWEAVQGVAGRVAWYLARDLYCLYWN